VTNTAPDPGVSPSSSLEFVAASGVLLMSGFADGPARSIDDAELTYRRHVLQAHATPLFALASLLIDDDDAATEVVVDVISSASPETSINAGAPETRARLAGSIYRRCLDLLSSRNRVQGSSSPVRAGGAAAVLAQLTLRHRAIVGLLFVAGQDAALAAKTLGVSQQIVLIDLLGAIESIRSHVGFPPLPRQLNPDTSSA
jgi:hypothetical protein